MRNICAFSSFMRPERRAGDLRAIKSHLCPQGICRIMKKYKQEAAKQAQGSNSRPTRKKDSLTTLLTQLKGLRRCTLESLEEPELISALPKLQSWPDSQPNWIKKIFKQEKDVPYYQDPLSFYLLKNKAKQNQQGKKKKKTIETGLQVIQILKLAERIVKYPCLTY